MVTLAVRDENLDRGSGTSPANGSDRLGEGLSPAVGEVVARDGRHDRVRQPHTGDGLGDTFRLARVKRERAPRVHEAETARSRAALTVDHERGGAVGPAFEDVRAPGFLADGHEGQLAIVAEPDQLRSDPGLSTCPLRLAARERHPLSGIDPGIDQAPIE